MNNCFFKKLKEDTNNPNLDRFGYLGFDINSENGGTLSIAPKSGKSVNVLIADGTNKVRIGTSGDYTNSVNVGNSALLYFLPGSYRVNIQKNNLNALGADSTEGGGGALGISINTIDLKNLELSTFSLKNTKIYGDFRNLPKVTSTFSAYMDIFPSYDFVPLEYLADLYWVRTHNIAQAFSKCTNIKGSIENLVVKLREYGLTTGSNVFNWIPAEGPFVSFKGTFKGGNVEFSWTATTITCNGETIDA